MHRGRIIDYNFRLTLLWCWDDVVMTQWRFDDAMTLWRCDDVVMRQWRCDVMWRRDDVLHTFLHASKWQPACGRFRPISANALTKCWLGFILFAPVQFKWLPEPALSRPTGLCCITPCTLMCHCSVGIDTWAVALEASRFPGQYYCSTAQ